MSVMDFGARPPAEAVAYLQDKIVGGRFSFDYRDVRREEHGTSFVVAKMMSADLLTDVHASLVAAIKAGQSRDQWMLGLIPTLQAKGWWGKAIQADPLTGASEAVTLGTPDRLRTIWAVNMGQAHSAGRWERFTRSAATRPNLTYKHTPQLNPRPDHQAWDGITLPIGHVFWETHCPKNGYGCKCYIVSRRPGEITSVDELERRGVFETFTYRNRRTGEEMEVPVGVDPGFGSNPGRERLAAMTPPPVPERQRDIVATPRTPRALPPLRRARDLPDGVRLREDLVGASVPTVFEAFSKVLGKGEGEIFTDRAQVPLVVGQRLFQRHDAAGSSVAGKEHLAGRAAYVEILAATLKDPDEIWHSIQVREDGSSVLVRNYVASFKSPDGRETFVASFHERGGVWWGTTAYAPGKRGKPRDQATQTNVGFRVGALVYRKK